MQKVSDNMAMEINGLANYEVFLHNSGASCSDVITSRCKTENWNSIGR